MQVHYHKSGKPETDRTRLGIYFSRTPVDRGVNSIPLAAKRRDMKITPGDANYEIRGALVLPDDQLFLGVTPHMHLIGKDMSVVATLPDKTEKQLVTLKNWDFNWQESYNYQEPILLPRGTRLDLVAHFDNSAGNRRNPNQPPKLVTWGEETTDEMCIAFFEAAPTVRAERESDVRPISRLERVRFMIEARRLAGEDVGKELLSTPNGRLLLQKLMEEETPGFIKGLLK